VRYGFVIDQTTCIGCHACTVACKTEHEVPLGVNRTWVKYIEKGGWPDTKRFFSVMRCNHCTDAPCVTICPTTALYKRDDGIVDFDTDRCIGCKSCMQACPYDALYIDPEEHTAQKCNYCAHRTDVGLQPACVVVCPEQAIIAGDLDDPSTKIAQMVATEKLSQRAVEQGTKPNLWYKGAHEASLDPLETVDPGDGGIWQDPAASWLAVDLTPSTKGSGYPNSEPNPNAAPGPKVVHEHRDAPARVVYNSRHPMPWGWRVSSYFLTKGIAAGLAIVMALALLSDAAIDSRWALWGVPLVAGVLLAVTGGLLVWDLKRPDRFLYLLTKGNPGSWLVRGAWILSAYAAVLGIWFLLGVTGGGDALEVVAWIAAVIGLAVAGYTAFLFGQAEARDLWQSPILLWHMIAGTFAAGGGATLAIAPVAGIDNQPLLDTAAWCLIGGAAALGLIALAELTSRHPTRNVAEAMHHLTKGAYKTEWWIGGQVVGVLAPIALGLIYLGNPDLEIVGAIAGVAAMAGIWFADDAYVKAGQSVPLS
jgi:Fe-S-cluster-containing dehydrogenase component/formate-dependent nitrite reductase membrane component NrfD